MMKFLCLTLLVCVLVNLVSAIYIPSNKNFQLQQADNDGVLSLTNDVSTQANPATIDICGDDTDILEIYYIKFNPNPPLRGEMLQIDFKGTLSETIYDGAYVQVSVKFGLVTLLRRTFDLCAEIEKIDEKCPLEKGEIQISREIELPKAIPPGKYTVNAVVYTVNEDPVTCLVAHAFFDRPKF